MTRSLHWRAVSSVFGVRLLAAILGGIAFVGIVLSIPMAAIFLSPGGSRGALAFLMVAAPFGLVFVAGAALALGVLRLFLSPERDHTAVGAGKYRYEIAVCCVGTVALPMLVFVAAEHDPWALGSVPVGAIAGWIAGTIQKRNLQVESRSSRASVPDDQ